MKAAKRRNLDELCLILPHTDRLVVTTGAFDVPHKGHRQYLRRAKEVGDVLVLILHSDNLISSRKGPDRPIRKQKTRLRRFSDKAYACVDHVIVAETQEDVYEAVRSLQPDFLVCSETTEDLPNCPKTMARLFRRMTKIIVFPAQSNVHSSHIIARRRLVKATG